MAGGFTTVSQVLQLIGQAPNKHGTKTAIEKLRAVKSLFPMFSMGGQMPPQMQELLQTVMKDGPQSLMQNPLGALGGALQGQMGGLIGKMGGLEGLGGITQLISGAGGLQATVGKLVGHVQGMIGLPGGASPFDLTSIIGHSGLASLGVPIPEALSMERVLAPVFSQGLLERVGSTLAEIENVVDNGWDPSGYAAMVMDHIYEINTIIDESNTALTLGLQTTLGVSSFSIIADGLDPEGTGQGILGEFFQQIVQPDAKAAIAAHHAGLAAEFAALKAVVEPDPAFDRDAFEAEEQGAE